MKDTKIITLKTDKEQKNEELIKKTEIKDSPFIIISTENRHFGTLGQYRLTEDYKTLEEAIMKTEKITWNRIIQVISLIHEIFKNEK